MRNCFDDDVPRYLSPVKVPFWTVKITLAAVGIMLHAECTPVTTQFWCTAMLFLTDPLDACGFSWQSTRWLARGSLCEYLEGLIIASHEAM
jgi:hypothetical protein